MIDNSRYYRGVPRLKTPPGACDCHSHIIGPLTRYPHAPDGRLLHGDALIAEYRATLDGLGIDRSVIIQPSCYATDNTRTVAAVAELGLDRARGVLVCKPDVTDADLAAWWQGGMRGIRFAEAGKDVTFDILGDMLPRLAPLGWHLQVQGDGAKALAWLDRHGDLPLDVVIPHIARLPKNLDLKGETFANLLRLLDTGRAWVKISGPYYGSNDGPPYGDVAPRIRALAEHRPDRLVWALNFPHPGFGADEKPEPVPFLDILLNAVPDDSTRNAILADNPARLYGFA
jgi:D-galactarolactone isomerase